MFIPKKYHVHVIALLAISVMILYPRFAQRVDSEIVVAGTRAAENFLQLVDEEKYQQSWDSSSALMREKIFLEVWSRQIPAMRDRVGQLISRQQEDASMSEWAEGAPDGKYLILTYASNFKKQPAAIETVILVLEDDDQWRIAGYFIK